MGDRQQTSEQLEFGGWVFEGDSCYFDFLSGFKKEWKSMEHPFIVVHLYSQIIDVNSIGRTEVGAILVDQSGAIISEFSTQIDIPLNELRLANGQQDLGASDHVLNLTSSPP